MGETLEDEGTSALLARVQRVLLSITAYGPHRDGRIVAAGALAVYFVTVAIPRLVWGINIMPSLGVPSAPTLFFDTRVITAGLECRRLGLDPLIHNPCDQVVRTMNYPRPWLLLRWLGLSQSHTDLLAAIFIVAFLVALFLLMGRLTVGQGAVLALAVCSPAVMFGIERGNVDIVMFAVMSLAVILWRKGGREGQLASPVVVLFAAIMKLYPVFTFPAYMFTRRRRAALVALICVAAFAVYAFIFRADIQAIVQGTPQSKYYAFGARILPSTIYHRFVPQQWRGSALTKQLIAIVPLVIGGPALWIFGRRRLRRPDSGDAGWHRVSFYFGCLLFLGAFAVGNSWDYRLVFLLLTLPQLFQWIADPSPDPRGGLAAIATVSILVLLYIGTFSVPLDTWDEIVTWWTVGLMLTLLAASIPPIPQLMPSRSTDVFTGSGNV